MTTKKTTTSITTPAEALTHQIYAAEEERRSYAEGLRQELHQLADLIEEQEVTAEAAELKPRGIEFAWRNMDLRPTALEHAEAVSESLRASAILDGYVKRQKLINDRFPNLNSDAALAVAEVVSSLLGDGIPVVATFLPIADAEAIAKSIGEPCCVVAQSSTITPPGAHLSGVVGGNVDVRYVGRPKHFLPLSRSAVVAKARDHRQNFGPDQGNTAEDRFTLKVDYAHAPVPRVKLPGTLVLDSWCKSMASRMAGVVKFDGTGVQLLSSGAYESSHLLTRPDGGVLVDTEMENGERITTVDAKVGLRVLKAPSGEQDVQSHIRTELASMSGFVPGFGIIERVWLTENHYTARSLAEDAGTPIDANNVTYGVDRFLIIRAQFRSIPTGEV